MEIEELKICERFKEVRIALDMKQGDFAKEIRTTQGHVSDIENKRKGVSNRVIEIICLKYRINEHWLRTGEGDMFIEVPEEAEFEAAAAELSKNNDVLAMQAVIQYWKLDDVSRKAVREYVQNICDNIK